MINMFSVHMSDLALARVNKVLLSGFVAEGDVVRELEAKFQAFVGNPFPVAVNSGTSAIHLALVLAGVGYGDEVITTAQTMAATSQAILMQGAKPVYADVQYETGNIDPQDVLQRITDKTRAILVVDWGGYPCDYDDLKRVAEKYHLPLIDDAAHALGASFGRTYIGDVADYTCFSFQAIKHITGGDGGMLTVKTREKYEEARRRSWFGIDREHSKPGLLGEREWMISELGFKYHMNNVAAAIAVSNLQDLGWVWQKRQMIANQYLSELKDVPGVTMLRREPDRTHANWLFTMHVQDRPKFCMAMRERGVGVSVVHQRIDRFPVFGGRRDDLPNLECFDNSQISIPMHTGLSDEDVETVIESVKKGW